MIQVISISKEERMTRIWIAALMTLMICGPGCGPSELEVELDKREAEVAKQVVEFHTKLSAVIQREVEVAKQEVQVDKREAELAKGEAAEAAKQEAELARKEIEAAEAKRKAEAARISSISKAEATKKLLEAVTQPLSDNYPTTAYIRKLISQGADVNARGNGGWTPLMSILMKSNCWAKRLPTKMIGEIETLLVAQGANVNAKTDDGTTVLMMAAGYGTPEVVRLILQQGRATGYRVNVNATDNDGQTALMKAAAGGVFGQRHEDDHGAQILRLLLAQGASFRFKDNDGRTALQHAGYDNDLKKVLKAAGAYE
jgi:ankyrin repeat protein